MGENTAPQIQLDQLVSTINGYNKSVDKQLISRAFFFAYKAHGSQRRANGDPYFSHVFEVAKILTGFSLDDVTIVTGLLHDTVEDTKATYEDIKSNFGPEIADLVSGVTNLSSKALLNYEAHQAENLRRLLTVMAKDIRVLLVKLADRLHNMRTIQFLVEDKKKRISRETMDIFAPLAGRMGMQMVREELEDLAFNVLQLEARTSIKKRFITLRRMSQDIIPSIEKDIKDLLDKNGTKYFSVSGREKRPYAIWKKLEAKEITFEQLSDIIAFRIIVNTFLECYEVLGLIHSTFRMIPERFKDYISNPKPNGYRSLHTTAMTPQGVRIEFQIRTAEMHDIAESGIAAHWCYKDGIQINNQYSVNPYLWLREVVSRLEHGEACQTFMERAKLEMMFDKIFCFTPRGEVIACLHGATVLDFAYAIHTDVGNTCIGARLDGRRVSFWKPVCNGQTIEILRSDTQRPESYWLDYVMTARARVAINRALREKEKEEFISLGDQILSYAFRREEVELSPEILKIVCNVLDIQDVNALKMLVGKNQLSVRKVMCVLCPDKEDEPTFDKEHLESENDSERAIIQIISDYRVGIKKSSEIRDVASICFSECCCPLPGENIIGIREPDESLSIHSSDCRTLEKYEGASECWCDVVWHPEASERRRYSACIDATLSSQFSALGSICTLIGLNKANILSVNIGERDKDIFKVIIDIEISGVRHLNNIISSLKDHSEVRMVRRFQGIMCAAKNDGQNTNISHKNIKNAD